jgi:hypothetical protein
MCDKCVELDGKIEHYQRMAFRITDQAMLDGIRELIERMKAERAALHSSGKPATPSDQAVGLSSNMLASVTFSALHISNRRAALTRFRPLSYF